MSSHHVVRDFQEPALLIADGEPCSMQLLEQLLNWSPVVVALDGAFPKLCELGIKVDYWLGDFDDLNPEEKLVELGQSNVEIVHTPDQNYTDFEKGIAFLIEKGAAEINIVWADGKRLDHAASNLSSFVKMAQNVRLVMYNNWSKMFLLPKQFEKWYPAGKIISLIPAPKAEGISTSGLKYELVNGELNFGDRTGSSNEALADGLVSITHSDGQLLMIEVDE